MEQSLLIIKPDGVSRHLTGRILARAEENGFRIVAIKMMRVDSDLARKLYAEHRKKPFFSKLVSYITSAPVVVAVLERENAITALRDLAGKTDPREAGKGTIRGDFGIDVERNTVHASDSSESAKREIELFFRPGEILP
ncbi:MAG: nucleoside-diphosphate kinase [Candidatus Hydrothermarchaeaceae archaeon]